MRLRTYAQDHGTWRAYQPHLPLALRLTDRNAPVESRWQFRDLSVHLDTYDAADAPLTVVVCHGGGSYGRFLAPLCRFLGEVGYRVVLPDLPGYGLTDVPPEHMRYPLWVETVAALAMEEKARTARPVALLGVSMGGMLAVHAAQAAPRGTIAAIVATTLMDAREPDVRAAIMRFPGGRRLVGLMPVVAALRVPMSLVANVHAMSSVPAINAICATDRAGGGNRVPIGFLHSWLTYAPPTPTPTGGFFDQCPVLLAHPAADRWTPTALSKRALDAFASATHFVALPRCEHFPVEEPGLSLFQAETLDFLRPFASRMACPDDVC